ncbi:pirin family protein [Actinospica durhamensis]|uniref:Pirin family protein n=1 Tax=Actinospica durhamensis TaxID=1508375 RepID=A0A941IQN2_9ACTN|nr:pirin family protein [Actinospica durhamensis]MBR7836429.1 pirin family protein [Actinospica durhamensis]
MSNLDRSPVVTVRGGLAEVAAEPVRELLTPRTVQLGESSLVRRLLPNIHRRMVGAWCFVDHYGPDDISEQPGMRVAPHPHTGLQTLSWLHQGEVEHRDSVGSVATIRPYELGLMTAGHGIAHSEQSPVPHPALLHGAQLWIALPDASRDVAPGFEHHSDLPVVRTAHGLSATLMLGRFDGAESPGTAYTPIVGMDLDLAPGAATALPLEPDFEYAALAMTGLVDVDGVPVERGSMLYLGCGRRELRLRSESGGAVMLLGGEPFEERIVMWWNFLGRTGEEVAAFREAWQAGERFGEVHGYDGARLDAPPLPGVPLKARGRVRED